VWGGVQILRGLLEDDTLGLIGVGGAYKLGLIGVGRGSIPAWTARRRHTWLNWCGEGFDYDTLGLIGVGRGLIPAWIARRRHTWRRHRSKGLQSTCLRLSKGLQSNTCLRLSRGLQSNTCLRLSKWLQSNTCLRLSKGLHSNTCLRLAAIVYICATHSVIRTPHSMCRHHAACVGLARTVYTHRIWPYVWWFPCQKYCMYTVYTYKCMVLANSKHVHAHFQCLHLLPTFVISHHFCNCPPLCKSPPPLQLPTTCHPAEGNFLHPGRPLLLGCTMSDSEQV